MRKYNPECKKCGLLRSTTETLTSASCAHDFGDEKEWFKNCAARIAELPYYDAQGTLHVILDDHREQIIQKCIDILQDIMKKDRYYYEPKIKNSSDRSHLIDELSAEYCGARASCGEAVRALEELKNGWRD